MRTEICERFGIDYPIFVFTPSEKVAAAVTRAGGLGVLGCVRFNDADDPRTMLQWMDANTDGKPYGVDVVMPAKVPTGGSAVDINKLIPQTHRDFVAKTLADLGVPPLPADGTATRACWAGCTRSPARMWMSLRHPIKLIANALGSPPGRHRPGARGRCSGGGAGGSAKHAQHIENNCGHHRRLGPRGRGHTGEIGSMVLWPEIVDAAGDNPVLAAGGIGTGPAGGRPLAYAHKGFGWGRRSGPPPSTTWACVARGGTSVMQDALLAATSADTVRRRIYTGKPARLLKSRWTEAWDAEGRTEPLPMPLQNILVSEAHQRMSESHDPSAIRDARRPDRQQDERDPPVADIIAELVAGFEAATERLDGIRES